jgi:predicted AAA+ superfamily ATPase
LHQLLNFLEDCFLVRTMWVEAASERRRMVNPRKAYPVDTGLIPVFDRTGRANLGHALETVVRLELERRGASLTYVRTREGHEVDFLVRWAGGGEALIQVCADPDTVEAGERETRALLEAVKEHPRASLHLVTLRPETALAAPRQVEVHWAPAWFLQA